MQEDRFLTKEDTFVFKAVAVILMFAHHLWFFPERIPSGKLSFIIPQTQFFIGSFGKICISMFFFVSGYGLYKRYLNQRFDLIGRLKKLYISYWKVLFIFVPIALIFFRNQIPYCEDSLVYARFNNIDLAAIIRSILGWSDSFNLEWWFLRSYIIAIITFPLVRKIVNRNSIATNIFWIIIVSILMTNVLPALGQNYDLGYLYDNLLFKYFFLQEMPYVSCFWMGILCAKSSLLDRLNESLKNKKLVNPIFEVLVFIAIVYLRDYVVYDFFDMFFVPILAVISVNFIKRINVLNKAMTAIGSKSTNMWLIHTFLCYYFYPTAKLISSTKWGILALLLLLVMTYIASIAVNTFWKYINIVFKKLERK